MTDKAVGTALTLYDAGTLTREQAARRAGVTTDRFAELCRRNGVDLTGPRIDAGGAAPANAD